jgi:hypothetical protein
MDRTLAMLRHAIVIGPSLLSLVGQVLLVCQVQWARKEKWAALVLKVHLEKMDQLVTRVTMDTTESLVLKVGLETMDVLEKEVSGVRREKLA